MCVSGSNEPPGQLVPPDDRKPAIGTFRAAHRRRREDRPDLVARRDLQRLGAELRREVDQVLERDALVIVRRRLRGKRLRRRRFLAGHVGLRHRPLFDREDRLPRDAVEQIQHRLLAHRGDGLDGTAADRQIDEHRRRRDVHVPDRMVDQLEVPLALAGPIVDRDDAFGEEVVAGTEAAVEVRARRLDRQIREAELFVGGNLIPDTGVAGHRPRFVQPRVVAEFAGTRNRVEGPQPLCRCARRSRGPAPWCCCGSSACRLRGTTTRSSRRRPS